MQKIRDISIGWKYSIALLVSIGLFIISAVIISNQFNLIKENIEKIERKGESVRLITDMASLLRARDIQISDFVNTKDSSYIDEYNSLTKQFDNLRSIIEPNMKTDLQKELLSEIIAGKENINYH